MSSYLTPYNIAIANKQKAFDVRNLKHDAYEAYQSPLQGGMRNGDYQREVGGDFWSDFADGFMSVMKPIGQVAQAVAPFLGAGQSGGMACRCPRRGACRCGSGQSGGYRSGMGLSGGDEVVDAEHPILNPDLNSTGLFHPAVMPTGSPYGDSGFYGFGQSGGYNQNISGMGMSGGDFLSDLGNTMSQIAPFLPLLGLGKKSSSTQKTKAVGRALLGCGFFDDLLDGIKKVGDVAGAVAPHVKTGMDLYGKYGKGVTEADEGQQVGMNILKELQALHGQGLSGGDFDWSTLASFAPLLLGLGMSGGESEPDMSYLEPFVSGFGMSGGSFIDDMIAGIENAVTKVGDFLEKGINKVNEGFDKVMPLVEKVGKVADVVGKFTGKKGEGMSGGALSLEQNMNMADAMGDIFSGMGKPGRAKNTRVLSGKQQLYKGGAIANDGIPPFNKITNAGMSGGDMSVNAPYVGFDMSSGKDFKRPVGAGVSGGRTARGNSAELMALKQRSNVNQPYKTGGKRRGAGQAGNSESLNQIEATANLVNELASANPAVNASPAGAGASGGRRPASKWIEHVKAYARKHGVSYKQALKDSRATYRGAGMSGGGQSGGDFWSDLGNVASSVAPFLPLLL
jgi:hypothetical protein